MNAGVASYTTTALASGTRTLTAAFTPAANTSLTSTSAPVSVQVKPAGIAVDQSVTATGTGSVTTAHLSTTGPALLVAYVGSDGPATKQTTTVTGAGLTWTLAQRANAKGGTAEIWTAYATAPLTNATITSTPRTGGYAQLLTVEVFTGASGVGAGAVASKAGGTPTVNVTTTTANSWVFAVGEDYTRATTITPGPNQSVLRLTQDTVNGDTFWVQEQNSTTPVAGTKVTTNDTAPIGDTWNLAAIEIIPAS